MGLARFLLQALWGEGSSMSTEATLWSIIIILVAAAAAAFFYFRGRRTEGLRSRFGPEYDRTVYETGSIRRAEADLRTRERRVAEYHIRPLTHNERAHFAEEWRSAQERFVDDPRRTVMEA